MHGIATAAKLQAFYCYYIGLRAKSQKKFTLAVEWLLEAKLQATIERKLVDIPAINAELVETIKHVRQLSYENLHKIDLDAKSCTNSTSNSSMINSYGRCNSRILTSS